jgi:hypothetical protein
MSIFDWLRRRNEGDENAPLSIETDEGTIAGLSLKQILETHSAWKERLQNILEGISAENLDVATVSQGGECELGKWIDGEGKRLYGNLDEYNTLRRAHDSFHLCAGEVLLEYQDGNFANAADLLKSKFRSASNKNQLELVRMFAAANVQKKLGK